MCKRRTCKPKQTLCRGLARESRDPARLAGQLEDVQPRVRTVDDVDIAAIVDFDVVGLDSDLAAIRAVDLDAALVGRGGDGRDEVCDLARMVRIANVDRSNACVEVCEKENALVVDGGEVLVRRMRPEASTTRAEVAARLRDREGRNAHRPRFRGDV